MSILLIGGDRLDSITGKLMESGFENVEHISGRKNRDKKIKISEKTDLVLVLVDYVGHKLAEVAKEESKKSDVKIVFSRRSWACMEKIIQKCIVEISNDRKNLMKI